ncbi:hypothetical protein [Comamonas sp.]|nr:hypothetical protein [Comamonas sp.]
MPVRGDKQLDVATDARISSGRCGWLGVNGRILGPGQLNLAA